MKRGYGYSKWGYRIRFSVAVLLYPFPLAAALAERYVAAWDRFARYLDRSLPR